MVVALPNRAARLFLLLLLAAGLPAGAQEAADRIPRRLLVCVETTDEKVVTSTDAAVMEKSLLTAVRDAPGAPLALDYGAGRFPSALAARNKAALKEGADAWLMVRISGTKDAPVLLVLSYDIVYKRTVVERRIERAEGFSLLGLAREKWDEIVPLVVDGYPPVAPAEVEKGPQPTSTLAIRALPGTRITGLTPAPIVVDPAGAAEVELASPSSYTLRASLPGYSPSRLSLMLNGSTEITVPQRASPRSALEATLFDGFFPGLGVTMIDTAGAVFLKLGFTTFRAGLLVSSGELTFASIPLTRFHILFGSYFGPEDAPFRFYAAGGPIVRLTWPAGSSLTVDALAPVGLEALAGCELPPIGPARIFAEYAPALYLTPYPALFSGSLMFNGSPGYITLPRAAMSLLNLRFGVRWPL